MSRRTKTSDRIKFQQYGHVTKVATTLMINVNNDNNNSCERGKTGLVRLWTWMYQQTTSERE